MKLFLLLTLISTNLFAMDFQTARSSGLVGEKTDGFIAAVNSNPTAQIKAIVQDINSKRKAKFLEVANKAGTKSLVPVGQSVHQKILAKLPKGAYYQNASGSWVRK